VEVAVKNPDSSLIEAITLLSGEIAIIDHSAQVGMLLLPLWKGHSSDILRAAEKLSKTKKEELKRQIKVRLREAQEGNG
jgi:outer membrane phospholipase A